MTSRQGAKTLHVGSADRVAFEMTEGKLAIAKAENRKRKLEEIVDQDPERTGKPERVSPPEMKRVWKE